MNMGVRLATHSDSSVLVEFNAAMAMETEQLELDRERLRKGIEALLSDTSKGLYYVIETDGTIVGQLMITYEWSDWRNGNFWWIQSVFVRPEFRKQGYFGALFRYIEAVARSRGDVCGLRLYVEKENNCAKKTYESLGMRHSHYELMEICYIS